MLDRGDDFLGGMGDELHLGAGAEAKHERGGNNEAAMAAGTRIDDPKRAPNHGRERR